MIKMNAAIIIAFAVICKISASEQCGYNLNDTSGYILSPNYPNDYGNNLDCSYIITTPEETLVFLEIVDMNTEDSYDYLTFYDGPSTDDQMISRYSGKHNHIFINATTNQVLVRFTADDSNSYKGFKVNFTSILNGTEVCGGDITGSSGTIHSPRFPDYYPENLDCYYSISTSENTAMILQIASFNIEPYSDYVIIYDGPTDEYDIIGNLTGSISTNDPIYVSTNQALVYFHTDSFLKYGSSEYSGFQINFTEIEKCEEDVSGSSGEVISPGYPAQPYPSNQNCLYKVTTSENTVVNLDIKDMDLEQFHDYIKIYDGPTTGSPLIGEYTGVLRNYHVFGTTNEVLIYFHSDDMNENRGFYMYFTEMAQICPAGGYTSDSGFLTSPLYPDTYPNNTDCYYSITTSSNSQITFHIDFLDVEKSSNCANDYVEIFDGSSAEATSMTKFCGSGPIHDIISSSNEVFLHFHSDNQNGGDGFKISYNTNPCPTSTIFYGDFGTIYSPGFPLYNYPNNAECSYNIEAPEGSRLFVTTVYWNLQSGTSDYITFYDGPTESSPAMYELSGTAAMSEAQFSSNQVLVTFRSDGGYNYRGFVINYVARYNYDENY